MALLNPQKVSIFIIFWTGCNLIISNDILIDLESSVGQDKVCCCGGAWLGVTARNGRSLSSSYNNGMWHHSSAIYSVALFALWAR